MKKFGCILALILFVTLACAPKPVELTPTPPAKAAISPENAARVKLVEAAKVEEKVNLYSYYMTGDTGKIVRQAFQDKYGINLEFITGVGNVLFERLKSEHAAKKNYGDVFNVGLSLLTLTKQEGLTEKAGELPSFTDRGVWTTVSPIVDPEEHIIAIQPVILSPYVNTELVKAGEEPKSYKELLDPKWKGKIITDSPLATPTVNWTYLALRKAGLAGDEYWRQLATQEPKIGTSAPESLTRLSRGEAHVLFAMGDSSAGPKIKEGAPIKPIEMLEGVVVVPAGIGLVLLKNAPHPNAARLFMDWMLSQEGQTIYAQASGGFRPIRKDVTDIRPAVLKLPMKKVLVLDYADMIEVTKLQREGTVAKLIGLQK